MSKREYLDNPKKEIKFQFGGNSYHLCTGRTYLDNWNEVPIRLAPDIADHVMRSYAFYHPVQGEGEKSWVTRGHEEVTNV